ncbi:hypothetical protein BYT27DRAFT_6844769 [Phlegmacium glaucopus]|nr:hypothetical protein BYT27DRAFT_6844769 [Phlegmacium glaucopus]
MRPLPLTDLSLDVQIHICEFLHPSQILALRQTCKAIHEATSRRIVWIHALNRICRENSLFIPTFPIAAMSMAELERAATAPLRWIVLSSKDRNNDEVLYPRRTRVIENPHALLMKTLQLHHSRKLRTFTGLYLVPGGRYLVTRGLHCLGVWDLGSVSDVTLRVHPTLDGLGIRILTYSHSLPFTDITIFEIYPQKESPELAKIAKLTLNLPERVLKFSYDGNSVVTYNHAKGTVIVWDFIANTAASWSISNPRFMDEVIKVTETTIITTHAHCTTPSLWIFQIPPLTTHSSLLDIEDPPELAPILKFNLTSFVLQRPDSWYYDIPIYIDILESHETGNYDRCMVDIACDLSKTSLVPIAAETVQYPISYRKECGVTAYYRTCDEGYRICDKGFVNLSKYLETIEAFTSSTSSGTAVDSGPSSDSHRSQLPTLHINTTRLAMARGHSSFCPASARLVYETEEGVVISDFL